MKKLFRIAAMIGIAAAVAAAPLCAVAQQGTLRANVEGKLGIDTATIPHEGIGVAKLAIDGKDGCGTDAVLGSHIQLTTDADNYPLICINAFQHDCLGIRFDAYYNPSATSADRQKSSSTTGNALISKYQGLFAFKYASGVAAGSNISS